MKRFLLVLIGSCFMGMGIMSAESDIQVGNPLLGLFYNSNIESADTATETKVYTYEDSSFFRFGISLFSIKNQNILFLDRFGFYEAIDLPMGAADNGYSLGPVLQISAGGVYKVFENDMISFILSAGPHVQLADSAFSFGADIDFQTKIIPTKLCSPVVGLKTNLNFYSHHIVSRRTEKLVYDEYERVYDYKYSYEDYSIRKFLEFYLQPYISFCVNFR